MKSLVYFTNKNTNILILYGINNFNNVYILLILSLDEKYFYLLILNNKKECIIIYIFLLKNLNFN